MQVSSSPMASCPACGTPHSPSALTCASCGASVAANVAKLPAFELDLPRKADPTPHRTASADAPLAIDLSFDPRAAFGPASPQRLAPSAIVPGTADVTASRRLVARAVEPAFDDVHADARLLAEYGEAPRHWLMTAPYAWRVIARRRLLRQALAVRRNEASRARSEVEDALVVFAERARTTAEAHPDYADALEELRRAEAVLRSRDRVLAAENDAHSARLASVDGQIARVEGDREQARNDERAAAAQLATAQAELARAEAGLKRAESELRAAQQRESGRGSG